MPSILSMNPATASVSCLDTEFTDLLAPELLSLGMVVRPLELDRLPGRSEAILAAQAAYEAIRKRGLERRHALADAHWLRAACMAATTAEGVKL